MPADLRDRLTALGQEHGGTLFMVLLAGFKALLARWSGQTDVAVGTAIAGRGRIEVEPLIGFFVNTLVLRSDLSGDPSFQDLLTRVRDTSLAAYDHQELPFDRLVEELRPDRDLSRNPCSTCSSSSTPSSSTPFPWRACRCGPWTWTTAPPSSTSASPSPNCRTDCSALSSTPPTSSTAPPWSASPSTTYGSCATPWPTPPADCPAWTCSPRGGAGPVRPAAGPEGVRGHPARAGRGTGPPHPRRGRGHV
ncbi:condensation domain-containing protein [Streptomyces sp. M19]